MTIYNGNKLAQEHLLDVAKHCIHAVLHAPQVTGRLEIKTEVLTGEDLLPIIEVFEELAKTEKFMELNYLQFKEAYEAEEPPVLVLIGADLTRSELGWDCGACGFNACAEFNQYSRENKGRGRLAMGPSCDWKALDYGIACDWACAAAHQYNIENRAQFSSGGIANLLGHLEDCSVVLGLPLGPCREFYYYNIEAWTLPYEEWKSLVLQSTPAIYTGFTGTGKPAVKLSDKWWDPYTWIKVEEDPEYMSKRAEGQERLIEVIMKKREQIEKKRKEIEAKKRK